MSIASQFPRLDALGLTIHSLGGLSYVDATELQSALTASANTIPLPRVIPIGGPTVATGWPPWLIERNLNRLAGSNASFGPTIGQTMGSCQ